MNHDQSSQDHNVVEVLNAGGSAPLVVVCEHASHYIPAELQGLGLTSSEQVSHVAWDPGAMPVAQMISQRLDAPLVASCVSRLVYDCNRPPEAPDAMPSRSEVIDVPGNAHLTPQDRAARTERYYKPFRDTLHKTLKAKADAMVVTVHSFTPVYHGKQRHVEIGILHDTDTRLADAMLDCAGRHTPHVVLRNAPYGPQDGVTHTLKEHALPQNRPNVMLELRNDLIATPASQAAMADMLSGWLEEAAEMAEVGACKS